MYVEEVCFIQQIIRSPSSTTIQGCW